MADMTEQIKEVARKYCRSLDGNAPCDELCSPCLNHAKVILMGAPLKELVPRSLEQLIAAEPGDTPRRRSLQQMLARVKVAHQEKPA